VEEVPARLPGVGVGSGVRVVVRARRRPELRAQRPDPRLLRLGRRLRDPDHGACARLLRGQGHRHPVVSRGRRDHLAAPKLRTQRQHRVRRAPQLERARPLPALELQIDITPGDLRKPGRALEGRTPRPPLQPPPRLVDLPHRRADHAGQSRTPARATKGSGPPAACRLGRDSTTFWSSLDHQTFVREARRRTVERILVTGAAGQIGSELVPALRARYGQDAVVASDIVEPKAETLADGPTLILDCTDPDALRAAVDRYRIDTIYHLAAILSARAEQDPYRAYRVNMDTLVNVLEVARDRRCAVFTPSSIGAFGPNTPRDPAPQDTIQRPTTMYGITKVAGELLCDYYHLRFGVDTRGLR